MNPARSILPFLSRQCLALALASLLALPVTAVADPASELRERVAAAQRVGAASLAFELARRQPQAFDALEMARLQHAAIAQQMRWAQLEMRKSPAPARTRSFDLAIAQAWQMWHQLPADAAFDEVRQALTYDLIFALSERGRDEQAIALFEQLRVPDEAVPPYVLVAAGAAYDLNQQRDKAVQALERALRQAAPGEISRVDVRERLIYLHLDRGRVQAARAHLHEIEKEAPLYIENAPLPETLNPDYGRVRRLQAQFLVYTGKRDSGQRALRGLQHDAPFSSSLRAAAADVRMGDGQPLAARQVYRDALNERPDDVQALIGLARSSLALRDYALARRLINTLSEALPENGSVRQLRRDLRRHDAAVLMVDAGAGRTQQSQPFSARHEWSIDTHVYSPPVAENFRIVAHQFTGRAALAEDEQTRVRNGVGVEYRSERIEAQAELHRSSGEHGRTGTSLQLQHYPADGWRLKAALDTDLNELPWGALQVGVHGRRVQAQLRWQPRARTAMDVSYQRDHYSDGNVRQSLGAALTHTLLDSPRHGVSVTLASSHSRNRHTDVPYFSPAKDVGVQLTGMYEWRPWRDGNRGFRQRIYGTLGAYRQHGYGTDPLWEVRLEQAWDLGRDTNLVYGLGYGQRPYDGEQEKRLSAYFSLNIPF